MPRLFLCLFALSATTVPPADAPSDELLRAANNAIRQKNIAGADKLLTSSEDRSTDPGLIAFNRAVMFFEAEEYREAEINFLRCLEDQAIPSDRRTHAQYNRGVCLVRRGDDEKLLRAAISCFEQCLDAAPADGQLARDARHNLELTKLLWNQARAKQAAPPTPNAHVEEPPPLRTPEANIDDGGPEPGNGSEMKTSPMAAATVPQPGTNPMASTQSPEKTAAAGNAPVLQDDATALQKISPDDTNRLLDKADARLRTARQRNEQMRAGPERPNVRDW